MRFAYRDALEALAVGLDSAKLAPEPVALLVVHHVLLHLAQFHGHELGIPLVVEELLRHLVKHLGFDVCFFLDHLVLLQEVGIGLLELIPLLRQVKHTLLVLVRFRCQIRYFCV